MFAFHKLLPCICAVILFVSSCKEEQPKRVYTDADYKQFTDSLGFAIRTGDSSYIMSRLNYAEMRSSFLKAVGVGMLAEDDAGYIFSTEISAMVATLATRKDHDLFKHLSTEKTGNTRIIYFRSFKDTRCDYLGVKVIPGAQKLLIDDIILFSHGMTFQERMIDLYKVAFIDNNKLLPGKDAILQESNKMISEIARIDEQLSSGVGFNAMQKIKQLPSKLQESMTIQLLEMRACAFNHDSLRTERLMKRTTDASGMKAGLNFLTAECCINISNYNRLLKSVEDLDAVVHDPMLDVLRGGAYYGLMKKNEAEVCLKKAVETSSNETRQYCYVSLLRFYVFEDKKEEALALANEMIEKAAFDKVDLGGIFMLNTALRYDEDVVRFLGY
ncbi:MAG: hypothetical protein ACRC3B_16055 [Bacteroidia bacterium]